MLFNSPEFLFLFLPVTLLVFHGLRVRGKAIGALSALLAASLFFYGWWNPAYLLLMLSSILGNFFIGRIAMLLPGASLSRKVMIGAGVSGNLLLLGYYKYAIFLLSTWAGLTGQLPPVSEVFLPLGISFFTFTQISYLMDLYNGRTRADNFLSYALFVTFFPHLIAGPIVHHRELASQFMPALHRPLPWEDVAAGITILAGGLFKKVILADTLATFATPIFSASANGQALDFYTAWAGAMAYTFQLYFDFSGYSDMALGLALLFGIRLPINFRSPYKATSIIDFWRRWHITLSHWLRDYLYFPLSGNRHGRTRQIFAAVMTMLLGGLWHGAGWTFVVWGLGHGILLAINYIWRAVRGKNTKPNPVSKVFFWGLTFTSVSVLWVIFRSPDFATVERMFSAMSNPMTLPGFSAERLGRYAQLMKDAGWVFVDIPGRQLISRNLIYLLAISFFICMALPNLYDFMKSYKPYLSIKGVEPISGYLSWKPSALWAIAFAVAFSYATINIMITTSTFLYFQF